jgi:hypothetical protein
MVHAYKTIQRDVAYVHSFKPEEPDDKMKEGGFFFGWLQESNAKIRSYNL